MENQWLFKKSGKKEEKKEICGVRRRGRTPLLKKEEKEEKEEHSPARRFHKKIRLDELWKVILRIQNIKQLSNYIYMARAQPVSLHLYLYVRSPFFLFLLFSYFLPFFTLMNGSFLSLPLPIMSGDACPWMLCRHYSSYDTRVLAKCIKKTINCPNFFVTLLFTASKELCIRVFNN